MPGCSARSSRAPTPPTPTPGSVPWTPPRDLRALRIGWIEYEGTDPEIRRVTGQGKELLVAEGHRVEDVEVRCQNLYPAVVDILAATEAAGTPPEHEAFCDPGRLEIVRHGRTLSGVRVIQAEEVRQNLRATLRSVMDRYDLLAMATVPIEPFEAGAIGPDWASDPRDLMWLAWAPASYPYNMTGQPAVSLPAGLTRSGLPAGVQLVGPVGADDLVLTVARRLEAMLAPLPHPPATGPIPVTTGERTF